MRMQDILSLTFYIDFRMIILGFVPLFDGAMPTTFSLLLLQRHILSFFPF